VASFTATVPGTYSVVVTDLVAGSTACAGTAASITPVFVPCSPGAGCTPGYWKNRKLTWNTVTYGGVTRDVRGCGVTSSNGVSPRYTPLMAVPSELKTALFRVVFDLTAKQVESRLGKGTGNITLIQALGLGDGSGYTQLARAGTAGLLNSCAMNYAPGANPVITSQSIVSDVRARFLSSNRNAALALALRYDQYNNSTCVIDNSGTLAALTTTATARQGAPAAGDATAAITVTAFPNPAYGEATIQFTVAQTGQASLDVFNTRGDKVKTLFNGLAEGGKTYRVTLKTDDRVVPGAYLYRVQSGTSSKTSRVIMLKQ
ncbi:MAG: T9SS type A sorting domain-containing protein, partial [Cytophagales bacterium]|nr:T9SS type A sorting domain-containing protein [Cytophagales bacterium]